MKGHYAGHPDADKAFWAGILGAVKLAFLIALPLCLALAWFCFSVYRAANKAAEKNSQKINRATEYDQHE